MTDEHTLDGRTETLDRLEQAARERWGETWSISATHFADGTTQAYAFRSYGRVDGSADLIERERLWVDDERAVLQRVYVRDKEVVELLDERDITDSTIRKED